MGEGKGVAGRRSYGRPRGGREATGGSRREGGRRASLTHRVQRVLTPRQGRASVHPQGTSHPQGADTPAVRSSGARTGANMCSLPHPNH